MNMERTAGARPELVNLYKTDDIRGNATIATEQEILGIVMPGSALVYLLKCLGAVMT